MSFSSSSSSASASARGIGLTGGLTILFVGLKLTGFIDWSWWWVLFFVWAPPAVILGILVVWFAVAFRIDYKKTKARELARKKAQEQLSLDIKNKEGNFAGS